MAPSCLLSTPQKGSLSQITPCPSWHKELNLHFFFSERETGPAASLRTATGTVQPRHMVLASAFLFNLMQSCSKTIPPTGEIFAKLTAQSSEAFSLHANARAQLA